MSELKTFPTRLALALLLVAPLLAFQCKKEEPAPTINGTWETITTVGFKFNYRINLEEDTHCRSLPEYFGDVWFCYTALEQTDSTFLVFAPGNQETWTYRLLGDEFAEARVLDQAGQTQLLLLKRLNE